MNFRKMPFSGYMTDASGNVISNASVTIKRIGSDDSFEVDIARAGVSGFFETKALPTGSYEVFESGVYSKTVKHHLFNYIPCFKSWKQQPISFQMAVADGTLLDTYKAYIQIDDRDTKDFFPSINGVLLSKFNVEYFNGSSIIKFENVGGIIVDGKACLEIGYRSISTTHPFHSSAPVSYTANTITIQGQSAKVIKVGDICMRTVSAVKSKFYVKSVSTNSGGYTIALNADIPNGVNTLNEFYSGMTGMTSMSESFIADNFTVTEVM